MGIQHKIPTHELAHEQDAQWFIRWAASRGLPEPSDADVEAFVERVAIKMEHSTDAVRVRWEVGMEWGSGR